jgi:hypothetical protein
MAAIVFAQELSGWRALRLDLGHCYCYHDAYNEEGRTCCDHPFLRFCKPFALVAVRGDREAVHRVAVVAEVLSAIARAAGTFRLHDHQLFFDCFAFEQSIVLNSCAPIPGYQKHPPELARWLDRASFASKS